MKNIIKINHARFWTENNEILYCLLGSENPNYRLESENVKMYIKTITKLCNGKPMPFIIDVRNSRGTFTTSAAKLFAKTPSIIKLKISEAFIVNSIGTKLLIASYKRIYDSTTPFGIFKNIQSAREYCIKTKDAFYGSN